YRPAPRQDPRREGCDGAVGGRAGGGPAPRRAAHRRDPRKKNAPPRRGSERQGSGGAAWVGAVEPRHRTLALSLWRKHSRANAASLRKHDARGAVILGPKAGRLDLRRGGANILAMTVQPPTPFHPASSAPEKVAFDRHELSLILA